MRLAVADADVAGNGEQLVQQDSPSSSAPGVVRSQRRKRIALGLVGSHLDDLGQVLSFGGELDHGLLFEDLGPRARSGTSRRCSKSCATRARAVRTASELAMGDLEAPHGRPALFGIVHGGGTMIAFEPRPIGAASTDLLIQSAALGIGDLRGQVLRLDLMINVRIEQELFAHVLEEVLLSPALEHGVGDFDVAQVPSTA